MEKIQYDGKRFKVLKVSQNASVAEDLIFEYHQRGNVLTCSYSGGVILIGQLLGKVDNHGKIEMSYQQILNDHTIQTGLCNSTPEILDNGKIRLHEKWKWTSGDLSEGSSILEEL